MKVQLRGKRGIFKVEGIVDQNIFGGIEKRIVVTGGDNISSAVLPSEIRRVDGALIKSNLTIEEIMAKVKK